MFTILTCFTCQKPFAKHRSKISPWWGHRGPQQPLHTNQPSRVFICSLETRQVSFSRKLTDCTPKASINTEDVQIVSKPHCTLQSRQTISGPNTKEVNAAFLENIKISPPSSVTHKSGSYLDELVYFYWTCFRVWKESSVSDEHWCHDDDGMSDMFKC